mgnify:CR=1 FL=1
MSSQKEPTILSNKKKINMDITFTDNTFIHVDFDRIEETNIQVTNNCLHIKNKCIVPLRSIKIASFCALTKDEHETEVKKQKGEECLYG